MVTILLINWIRRIQSSLYWINLYTSRLEYMYLAYGHIFYRKRQSKRTRNNWTHISELVLLIVYYLWNK